MFLVHTFSILLLGVASASVRTVCDALLARVCVNGSGFGFEWKWEIFDFIIGGGGIGGSGRVKFQIIIVTPFS